MRPSACLDSRSSLPWHRHACRDARWGGYAQVTRTMTPPSGPNPQMQNLRAQTRRMPNGRLRAGLLAGTCLGPDQIRTAYGFQSLLNQGIDGTGRTIVIIDAYGSPTLASDTSLFDAYFGLAPLRLNTFFPDGPPLPTSRQRVRLEAARRRSTSRRRTRSPRARRSTSSLRSRTTTLTSSARRSTSPITISATPSRRATARPSSAWVPDLLAQQHGVFSQMTRAGERHALRVLG